MPTEPARNPALDDEPDPREVWRWVSAAARPWLGWVLIGVGALLMLFGYLGVSREALPGKQIPYLVSGGIGGMLVAVLGAYFLATQELRRDSGRLDRLEAMVEDLHIALVRRPDAPDVTALEQGANGSGRSEPLEATPRRVVAVEGGELFHRAGCSMVAGKDVLSLTQAAARKQGLRPCPACAPAPASVR
jgi:hypothetical protein